MKKRHIIFFYFALIFAFSLFVYFPSCQVSFQLDDIPIIEKNPVIRSLHPGKIWSYDPTRFLVHFSFALNYAWGKLDVWGYHIINFIFHLAAGVGVYFFCLEIFRICLKRKEKEKFSPEGLALFASCLFLVHPIQTSAVTYIVQRVTVFAAFFYIWSMNFYLYSRKHKRGDLYIFSLVSAACGALCKPILITLPIALMALEFIILRDVEEYDLQMFKKFSFRIPLRQEIWGLLPYFFLWFLVPGLLMLFTQNVQLNEISRQTDLISRSTYLLTQFNVLIRYIRLIIIPLHQNFDYSFPLSETLWEFPTWLSLLLLLILLSVAVINIRKNKLLSFSIFFFFIALSLESSIFPLSDVIFEHRLYLALLSWALLLPKLVGLFGNERFGKITLWGIFLVCGFLTFQRNELWSDKIRFLKDVAEKSFDKPRPQVNLGIAYMDKELWAKARERFVDALEIDPNYSKAYLGLGTLYLRQGEREGALFYFQKAIELAPENDEAYNNVGVLLAGQKESQKALKYFEQALILNPSNIEAYNNRARIYEFNQQYPLAIRDYSIALEIDPTNPFMYLNRSRVFALMKEYPRALQDVERAESLGMDLDPKYKEELKAIAAQ